MLLGLKLIILKIFYWGIKYLLHFIIYKYLQYINVYKQILLTKRYAIGFSKMKSQESRTHTEVSIRIV